MGLDRLISVLVAVTLIEMMLAIRRRLEPRRPVEPEP